jgi:hypothetical protein
LGHPPLNLIARLILGGLVVLASGCSSLLGPETETAAYLFHEEESTKARLDKLASRLNPSIRYLLVHQEGNLPTLLVLGNVLQVPGGPVEVWYSAGGELFKFQSGRMVGTNGLPVDWTSVRFLSKIPSWETVSPDYAPVYMRSRSELPGYRSNIKESMRLTRMVVSADGTLRLPFSLSEAMPPSSLKNYTWFREQVVADSRHAVLPESWFAVAQDNGEERVVFSRQCVSAQICFQFLQWPLRGTGR